MRQLLKRSMLKMKPLQVIHTTEHSNAIAIDELFTKLKPTFKALILAKQLELPLIGEYNNQELLKQSLLGFKATVLTYMHSMLVAFEANPEETDITISKEIFIARILSGYFNIPFIYRAVDMPGWSAHMPAVTKTIPFFTTLPCLNSFEGVIENYGISIFWTGTLTITLITPTQTITV